MASPSPTRLPGAGGRSPPASVPADPVAAAAPPAAPPVSRDPPQYAPYPSGRRRRSAAGPSPADRLVGAARGLTADPGRHRRVGVTARIGPLGLNRDGTLEVPSDFGRAGWYTGRPTPGEAGPAIIVAHRASRRGPGAFWKLPDVQPGQQIVVTRADGRRVLFAVERVEQHRKDAFPTAAVYGPTPETALRLITCGGPFEPALGDHYRDNVIVFARMIGWA